MQKIILVYSLLFGLILNSCDRIRLKKYLSEIRNSYSYLDETYDWEIVYHYNADRSEEFYHIESIRNDTLVELMFSKFYDLQKISDLKLFKSYNEENNCHRLIIKDNDTVVYFITTNSYLNKFNIDKEKILLFEKGTYSDQYENGLMTEKQRTFYKFHKDSLDLIKGRNLIPLPEI